MKYLFLLLTLWLTACAVERDDTLKLEPFSSYDLEITKSSNGDFELVTTGVDPQIFLAPSQETKIKDTSYILAFEYFCPDGVDFVEVFYAADPDRPNWSQDRQVEGGRLPKAEAWQPYSINLQTGSKGKWKPNHTTVRFDFGRRKGLQIQIRNVHFREPTEQEKLSGEEAAAIQEAKVEQAQLVDDYLLRADWPATIDSVIVGKDQLEISGTIKQEGTAPLQLIEFAPHEDPWEPDHGSIANGSKLDSTFKVTLPRYTEDGKDRIANRFAVATTGTKLKLSSVALWPTDISGAAVRDMPRLYPANKKGLGGVSLKEGIFEKDLSDLGITASTVNILLGSILQASPNPIEYIHQGVTYQFNGNAMKEFDTKISWMTENDIVVSAILLVDKNANPLVHPDYNTAGLYSMGNLTTQKAADTYRALVSFLAERYSRPDREHGWISHWIVFNEVDYGWIWTNMGEQPMALYMDAYEKAMRLTYLEARRFNPTAEVFISLTHHWNYSPADKFRAYPPRDLLDRLALYSNTTGEYEWALAYHPYPQSLLKPRIWEDSKATASFDTRYITPKNIEVLDKYLHQPQFLYEGKPRTVVLSEQGYHTPDYSEKSMRDKAAAIAYTWEKILPLKTVESFHYHRWVDHPLEGGLKVGLRTLPEPGKPFGKRKEPAFSLFSQLETPKQSAATEPYKKVIGIKDWEEIRIPASEIKK